LLLLLDDSPIVPGQERAAFGRGEEARDILNDAESSLRAWTPSWQEHDGVGSVQDEPSVISTATGGGHTSDGTHLAEATSAPLPQQAHADLHHDPTAASTAATAGVPSEAGYSETAHSNTATAHAVEQPHAV
jgi:hypothetical protein